MVVVTRTWGVTAQEGGGEDGFVLSGASSTASWQVLNEFDDDNHMFIKCLLIYLLSMKNHDFFLNDEHYGSNQKRPHRQARGILTTGNSHRRWRHVTDGAWVWFFRFPSAVAIITAASLRVDGSTVSAVAVTDADGRATSVEQSR